MVTFSSASKATVVLFAAWRIVADRPRQGASRRRAIKAVRATILKDREGEPSRKMVVRQFMTDGG
jgi:hypothetical protein